MLIDLIRQAGVVGAGGAGFPTHVKLASRADCFIVNAAECEPLIETDKYLIRMFAKEIVDSIIRVGEHLGASRRVIAIKRKYSQEIAALNEAISQIGANIELFLMDSFYPAGDEQVIVQLVSDRSVPERGIPLSVGAVVDNVGTMLSVHDALLGVPVTDKYLSVTGEVEKPVMLKVPLGTSLIECVLAANPKPSEYELILGGPMMGKLLTDKSQFISGCVTKTTGNILVLPKGHHLSVQAEKPLRRIIRQAQSACLQCQMCTDQCPRYRIGHRIRPHKVMRGVFIEPFTDDTAEYERLFGDAANCSECGLCELSSCPMGLSPRRVNVYLKGRLREKGIDVPKNESPKAREALLSSWADTDRLNARLGLGGYAKLHAGDGLITLSPAKVTLPLSQHIGAPAVPVKKTGERVSRGELIAAAREGALSANIHAGIDGIIERADEKSVTIAKD